MNPRNLTREAIEQSNDIEPYCFETDREEQWFNVGLQYGLDVADSDPISPWISVEDDLPYNNKELLSDDNPFCYEQVTKGVIIKDLCGTVAITIMVKENNKWKWVGGWNVEYWMPIPA